MTQAIAGVITGMCSKALIVRNGCSVPHSSKEVRRPRSRERVLILMSDSYVRCVEK